ncbi:MAG: hypothetical protein V7K49_13565 [Nostoc sp.]
MHLPQIAIAYPPTIGDVYDGLRLRNAQGKSTSQPKLSKPPDKSRGFLP